MVKKLGVGKYPVNNQLGDVLSKQSEIEGEIMRLSIEHIMTDPTQPRKRGRILPSEIIAHKEGKIDLSQDPDKFRREKFEIIKQYSSSIQKKGLIHPIVVKKTTGEDFIIVAGETRYLAHLFADIKKIRSSIRRAKHADFTLSLIENLHQTKLPLTDIIDSVLMLRQDYHIENYHQLCDTLHLSDRQCQRYWRFANAPESLLKKVSLGEIQSQSQMDEALNKLSKEKTVPKKRQKKVNVGRQRASVQLGHKVSVKDGFIVKKVIEKISGQELCESINWENLNEVQNAWNKMLKDLIESEE